MMSWLQVYMWHLHSPSLQVQLQVVSQRIGVVWRNLRGVALAVRVIAGSVDRDFDVQLLLVDSGGECKGCRGPTEGGVADHGCRVVVGFRGGGESSFATPGFL